MKGRLPQSIRPLLRNGGEEMRRVFALAAALALLCLGSLAQANITIVTVPVGDARNWPDNYGWGQVTYTYNIGKYEVTAGQYTAFLNAVGATDTYTLYNANMWSSNYGCKIERSGSPGSYTYSVASGYANRPVNYVSWGDSARFANWLHNGQPTGLQNALTTEDGAYVIDHATTNAKLQEVTREADWRWAITSEDEWYKAAYYKGGNTNAGYWNFPTRTDAWPGRDMADASGNNANYGRTPPYPIDSPYYTTVAGEFQNSRSPYGTFDQGGNVREWNEIIIGAKRCLRGAAFYFLDASYIQADYRDSDYPANEDFLTGFRVSAVPEPSSLIALAAGLVGLLGIRRRRA